MLTIPSTVPPAAAGLGKRLQPKNLARCLPDGTTDSTAWEMMDKTSFNHPAQSCVHH